MDKTSSIPRSPVWTMADRLLGGALRARLTELRGSGLSYEAIASSLHAEAGVAVTSTTIAAWCRELGIDKGEPVEATP